MSWREQLRPASFRGVAFYIDSHDATFGRRTQVHEYPLRDRPYVEDLGLAAKSFSVEAYVLGVGYMAARDQLMAAIDAPGPGILVHPYLGERTVVCTSAKLREQVTEGGVARLSLTFHEAGNNVAPAITTNTRELVAMRADAALDACEADFAQRFSVAQQPAFVSAAATEVIAPTRPGAFGVIPTLRSQAKRAPVDAAGAAQFERDLTNDQATLPAAMSNPQTLGQTITNRVGRLLVLPAAAARTSSAGGSGTGVAGAGFIRTSAGIDGGSFIRTSTRGLSGDKFSNPGAAYDLLTPLTSFGSSFRAVPAVTPARSRQQGNQSALVDLVQQSAVVEQARATSGMTFLSGDEAIAVRSKMVERFEGVLVRTANDRANRALAQLRTAVVRDLTERAAKLPKVVRVTYKRALPSLVLAQRIYGDARRDVEIEQRNKVRHPMVVPGGQALEVLS